MSAKNKTIITVIALALATFAVFSQVLRSEFVNFDDPQYVIENTNIQNIPIWQTIKWAFTSGYAANWHPITWLSHTLDYKLFGLNPAGYHLTNLLLHIANTLLLLAVLNATTSRLWPSVFVAALFALHPLHVESVAWVAERKDVLSTFFTLLTMVAYLCYTTQPNARLYSLTLILFTLGLMSKPMLVTLPFVLLLFDYWPLNRLEINNGKQVYRRFFEKIPFFILSAISSIVTSIVQQHAMTDIETFPLRWRTANAVVSYIRYIEKMFVPRKLAVLYPLAGNLPKIWLIVAAVIFLLVVSILIIRFSPRHRYLLVGWLWFIGTLAPVIGLVQVGMQQMADRYTYVPLIGLFILVTWLVADIFSSRKFFLTIAALVVLTSLSICTILQVRYWRNSMSLFAHAIAVTNYNYISYNNLGYAYVEKKNFEQAIENYKKAISINRGYADAYSNLGAALAELSRYDEAIDVLTQSLNLKPDNPKAYCNLGIVYNKAGRYADAVESLNKSLKLKPNDTKAYFNLGIVHASADNWLQAIEAYNSALKTAPSNNEIYGRLAAAHNNLAVLLLDKQKIDEAIGHLRQAIQTDPNYADAYNNLGLAYGKINRLQDEIEAYKQAAKIKPNYVEAYYNLGASYSNLGRYTEAIQAFGQAIKFKPEDSWAHFGLGTAYLKTGNKDAATQQYNILKPLDPDLADKLSQLISKQ